MLKSTSTALILLGVITGVIAITWPGVTVLAPVILFAIYAFTAAGLQGMRAFGRRNAGPVLGHLLLGLIDLTAGVIALAWPGPTALVLILIVGFWAIAGGLSEIMAAFGAGETAGTRGLFIVSGLVSVARRAPGPAGRGLNHLALGSLLTSGLSPAVRGSRRFPRGPRAWC